MFDIRPMLVNRHADCPLCYFLNLDRSKIPLVDADIYAVSRACPLVVDVAEQLQGASACAVPSDHRIVAEDEAMITILDLRHVLCAGPGERDYCFVVVIADDQMLAARQAVKPALELCRIISTAKGEISQDPEIIIMRDAGLEVGDQGRVHLRG